jgi:TfoX/Sxy family transcriptional regulator of competence genes
MASDLKTVAFIADQSGLGTRLTHKRMFGEYALYLNTKVVAFVCDNKLFLKPTDAGRALLGSPTEAPAYPGSKNYFLLEEQLEDPALLRKALEVTESVLPLPKPKTSAPKKVAKAGQRAKPKSAA